MSDDLLAGAQPTITLTDQIRCVEREIRKRHQVYPRLVSIGKMTAGAADREIAVMTRVMATLQRLEDDGKPNPS